MFKLTAYQRIEALVDTGTFEEIGAISEKDKSNQEAVITGVSNINNRQVFIIAIDVAILGGSIGGASARKINHILDIAVQYKTPVITLFESVGARIQEGVVAMHHIGIMFRKFAEISGVVPTIALQFGINSGATAYAAGLMNFIIMVENHSFSFITGPKVIEKMISEKVSMEDLGGTSVHGSMTGLATFIEANEYRALLRAKQLLDYLPQHCFQIPSSINTRKRKEKKYTDLENIIPQNNSKQGYDMNAIIQEIVDDDTFLELYKNFAPNIIVGFAKLGDASIAVVANQPLYLSGILDVDSCKKLFRFIQICDAYNIQLLFIADSPGFMPGKEQEQASMIGFGARILNVLATSTVPKITLIVNKIIGGAYGGMNSSGLGADMVFAWPTAQIAILGANAALSVIYQKEIEKSADKETVTKEKIKEYAETYLTPYHAAHHGQIDAIIHPDESRKIILNSFAVLQNKVIPAIKRRRNIIPM